MLFLILSMVYKVELKHEAINTSIEQYRTINTTGVLLYGFIFLSIAVALERGMLAVGTPSRMI